MTLSDEHLRQSFCKYARDRANDVAGKVLICPPSANRSHMLERIPRKRVAMISGWAVDPNAVYRYQVDAAFALSDHADYEDLIHYVELVRPRRVLTLHGFAAAFASDLRARGLEAWALTEENQMELHFRRKEIALQSLSKNFAAARPPCQSTQHSEFLDFANVGEGISATAAKLEKVRLLSHYLRGLTSEQLPIATTYFTGRAFAQ